MVEFQENNTGKEKNSYSVACLEHSRFFQKVKGRTFTPLTTERSVRRYCQAYCVISRYEKLEILLYYM